MSAHTGLLFVGALEQAAIELLLPQNPPCSLRPGQVQFPEPLQPEHLTEQALRLSFTAPPPSGCSTNLLGAQPPSGDQET